MAENFIFSANAVFPIFIVIALGYLLRQKQFLSASTVAEMNRLVFSFALPLMLFRNIYRADFGALFDPGFIVWLVVSITLSFVLVWLVAEVYLRNRKELIGGFVQASFRTNFAIVGLPLIANIMGEGDTGKAALATAFIVGTLNVLSVIVLTAKNSESSGINAALLKGIVKSICTNPSIIGIAAAVAVNLLGIPLPHIAEEGVRYMAVLCTPLALIAVGGSIQVSELMKYYKPALVGSALKIVFIPIIFMAISLWMGFRGEDLAIIFVLFANPTAIISYAMAARMNGHAPVTAAIIITTTVCSSVTLTIGVFLLRTFSLI